MICAGAAGLSDMQVKCPKCPAETDIGLHCDDVSDTRYKLLCPEMRDRLAAEGGSGIDLDCINMRTARDSAIRKYRRWA
jgi:hypothetical protein